MAREKRLLSLDPSVHGLLGGIDNVSDYISRIVQQRWSAWIDALDTLRGAGWTKAEVLASVDALNGTWFVGAYRTPEAIALELHDFALDEGAAKWSVGDTWAQRVAEVRERREIADSIDTLAREVWAGNTVCEQAIRRIGLDSVEGIPEAVHTAVRDYAALYAPATVKAPDPWAEFAERYATLLDPCLPLEKAKARRMLLAMVEDFIPRFRR